jgi:hypothetical protein
MIGLTSAVLMATLVGMPRVAPVDAQVDDEELARISEVLTAAGATDVPLVVRNHLGELAIWARDVDAWPPGSIEAPAGPTQWMERLQWWRDVAPEWRDAAQGFAQERSMCRQQHTGPTVSASVPECVRQLAARLQVRHAERLLETWRERIGDAEDFAEPARSRVLDALGGVYERAMDRLRLLERDRDPVFDGDPLLDRDRIRDRLGALEGLGQPPSVPSSVPGSTTSSPGTSGPATSGPATSGPATSGPPISQPFTSDPVTPGPVTSGPATSGPVTSGPEDRDEVDDDRSARVEEVGP